jgi:hypothetical protein
MATITGPYLTIAGSTTLGRADLTVLFLVNFDEFDRNTNQPFHAHARIIGDDTGVGDPSSAGPTTCFTSGVSETSRQAWLPFRGRPCPGRSHSRCLPPQRPAPATAVTTPAQIAGEPCRPASDPRAQLRDRSTAKRIATAG